MSNETTALHWFAFKVFFNRVFAIETFLNEKGVETYLPCETVYVMRDEEPVARRRPMIASLMFFRSTSCQARQLQMDLRDRVILYTDNTCSCRKPYPIPDNEMEVFRMVTSAGEKGLEFTGDVPEYRQGQHVRVIDGPYKGAEGYVRRIKGNRRLVVSIQGVCAVLTSYVPSCFLEKLD